MRGAENIKGAGNLALLRPMPPRLGTKVAGCRSVAAKQATRSLCMLSKSVVMPTNAHGALPLPEKCLEREAVLLSLQDYRRNERACVL